MQIKQFQYAQIIAEEGSITHAAKKLFISQQALSESLKLLESELGFAIFKRSRKGVIPTPTGRKFLDDLMTIMPIIDKWSTYISHEPQMTFVQIYVQYALRFLFSDSNMIEALSVSDSININWHALNGLQIIEELQKSNDAIGLLMLEQEGNAYQKLNALIASKNYILHKISDITMTLVLRADDPLAHRNELSFIDLAQHKFVCHMISKDLKLFKQITLHNNNSLIHLPEIVDIPSFIFQHPYTFAYLPDISVKNNILFLENKIVCLPPEGTTCDSLSCFLLYNKAASNATKEIAQNIIHWFK